ncbi:MAG: FAD-dependent oxidoreductase [Gammaproteobacteria bacterium]
MKTVIIGGGLAGLACAVELVDRGTEVTILECAPILGGKAASWRDEDGDIVDLGQHVVTPLYKHLLGLLKKVEAYNNLIWRDGHYYLAMRGGLVDSIRIAKLPPPLHFLVGLFRYKHLGLLDRLSALPAFTEILLSTERHRRKFDHRTFRDWIRSRGATEALVEHMLDPMIEGLMFLSCHHVATTNVMFDLHYMLLNKDAARFGFFDGGLQENLITPIVNYVMARGGEIHTGKPVTRIRLAEDRVAGLEFATGEIVTADTYVSAVPVHALCGILPEHAWNHPYFADLWYLEPVPVIGVQLWFDRKVTDISDLILTPKCIFNAYVDASNILTEYRARRGSIIHFVLAPAKHLIPLPDARIVQLVYADFKEVFPAAEKAHVIKSRVVKTPRAFYRQYPGVEQYRPSQWTPIKNFFLAGEFTRTKYPPCMEGAVKSGQLAAECLLEARNPKALAPIYQQAACQHTQREATAAVRSASKG